MFSGDQYLVYSSHGFICDLVHSKNGLTVDSSAATMILSSSETRKVTLSVTAMLAAAASRVYGGRNPDQGLFHSNSGLFNNPDHDNGVFGHILCSRQL